MGFEVNTGSFTEPFSQGSWDLPSPESHQWGTTSSSGIWVQM